MVSAGEVKAAGKCPADMVAIPAGAYNGKKIEALCVDQTELTNKRWSEVEASGYLAIPLSCPNLVPMPSVGRFQTAADVFAAVQAQVDGKKVCGVGAKAIVPTDVPMSPSGFDRSNQPRVNLNGHNAKKVCEDQGKRLLTPDEWAYVASKGGRFKHSTRDGSFTRSGIVYCDAKSCLSTTADVGSLVGSYIEYNGVEVQDMNGNVWEWTYDPITENFYLSGGSWNNDNPGYLAADDRHLNNPGNFFNLIGVRCGLPQGS